MKMEEVVDALSNFYTYGNSLSWEDSEKAIGDYHLVRGKKFLQLLHSYYTPIVKEIG
jgi:hypothetical protein